MFSERTAKVRWFRWASLLATAFSLLYAGLPAAAIAYGEGQAEIAKAAIARAAPAPSDKAIQAFNAAAEALYNSVRQGDRLGATRSVQELERSFRQLPMSRIPNSEGVQSLAASVSEMKRAWAAVSPDDARIERAAGSLRMAADALANPTKPMWHQYQSVLIQDTKALVQAIESSQAPKDALGNLTSHYRIIRTAASLQVEPSIIERVDSVLRYADRLLTSNPPRKELLNGLGQHIREAIDPLFPPQEGSPTNVVPLAPPSWGIPATIGSFIITILSWAGWRKFRFDRDHPGHGSEASKNRKDAASRWFR